MIAIDELRPLRLKAQGLPYPGTQMVVFKPEPSIPGAGFFPEAWGTVDPYSPLASRPVMVLGQDQDRIGGLAVSIRKKSERHTPTWKNMEMLFGQAGIPMEACFFTNFIMGIRQASNRNTGPSPALAHPDFMKGCAELFMDQLQAQRPKLIIAMGMIPFQLLALVSKDLHFKTVGIHDFAPLDERGTTSFETVFDTPDRFSATVVPICHPCYPQNGAKRKFTQPGAAVNEAALLHELYSRLISDPNTLT